MNSTFCGSFSVSLFGQSHGPAIGVVLDGIPAGLAVDETALQAFLSRRAPGSGEGSTARRETDQAEFLGGILNGRTCGAPIAAIIRNQDAKPADYGQLKNLPRPGHADYTAQIKYGGWQDARGGGHFSGRLTAALCIAGGLCLQFLAQNGIKIHAEAVEIGGRTQPEAMAEAIRSARADGDSVGGIIECTLTGLPAGLGGPLFGGLEGRIAQMLYAIPGVKGTEFGDGFAAARMRGSEHNDAFAVLDGQTVTETNHCGGILGGISDAMPLVFRAAVKPTPSIAKPQTSVSLQTAQVQTLSVSGRHDACIVPRAVPCVEAAAAIAVYDAFLERKKEL